jgi:hypothetical protein
MVGVDEDAAGVGVWGFGPADLRPGHVHPGKRGLHQVLGQMLIPGRQQAGGSQQSNAASGDERREFLIAR